MAWFKRDKKSIEQTTPPEERRVRTEGLWVKCESCRTIVFRKDLEANLFVCPKCQFHFKMNSKQRLEMLLDGRWTEHDAGMTSTDPLKFVDTKSYASRLKDAKKASSTAAPWSCVPWNLASSAAPWAQSSVKKLLAASN